MPGFQKEEEGALKIAKSDLLYSDFLLPLLFLVQVEISFVIGVVYNHIVGDRHYI